MCLIVIFRGYLRASASLMPYKNITYNFLWYKFFTESFVGQYSDCCLIRLSTEKFFMSYVRLDTLEILVYGAFINN